MNSPLAFAILIPHSQYMRGTIWVFNTTYIHAIRIVLKIVLHSLIKALLEGAEISLCIWVVWKILHHCAGRSFADGQRWKNNNCPSKVQTIDTMKFIVHEHKTIFGLNFLQLSCIDWMSTTFIECQLLNISFLNLAHCWKFGDLLCIFFYSAQIWSLWNDSSSKTFCYTIHSFHFI